MVIVYEYLTPGERTEVGRAWLTPGGAAQISGFDDELLAEYEELGIHDFSKNVDVPLSAGKRFLDVLFADNQGSYRRAERA